jgi:hypothetical protein
MAKHPNWQNRIVDSGEEDADQLLANPFNARIHPQFQQQALEGVLDSVGWVQRVIVNRTTQHVIDGHLRIALAITHGEKVPVDYVDLTVDEEKLILASFDYITQLAVYDKDQLDTLLKSVNSDNEAVQQLLASLATKTGIIPPDNPYDEWAGMPEFEQEDTTALKSIQVHFASGEDLKAFADLVGQTITMETKSVWFPSKKREDLTEMAWSSEP